MSSINKSHRFFILSKKACLLKQSLQNEHIAHL